MAAVNQAQVARKGPTPAETLAREMDLLHILPLSIIADAIKAASKRRT